MSLKRFALFATCVALVGCAADSKGGSRGNASGNSAGNTADAGSGSSTDSIGGGQNASVVNGAAGTGAADAGGATAADGGGLQAIAVDQCGASNGSGLSGGDLAALLAGGPAAELGYLYPYDGTVFPRGLIAPMLMWKGADDAEAVYVHVKSSLFELKGCYKPSGPGQLQMPADVWSKAEAMTQGSADPFSIELHTIKGGVAQGPIRLKVVIAQATLKGSIFYNSYESKLSNGQGAVLRVVPGKEVDLFVGGAAGPGCNGCHSVSASGARLVTTVVGERASKVYALDPNSMPNPPLLVSSPFASFVGLSPDGSVYLSNSDSAGGVKMRVGGNPATTLYETDTGKVVSGTGIPTTALMPTFSADGKLLVFNDTAIGTGKGLAVMDYDASARTASNYRKVYESSDDKLAGWPFVLPDDKAMVFQRGVETDFSGGDTGISLNGFGLPIPGPTVGPYGNLFILDIASGKATLLAKAMGYDDPANPTAANSFLPFKTDELDMSYYPTVSPVAAGGYFWVFFDSERHYGNRGLYRQLWGTAVTISPTGEYTTDPSHPAFYLTGQEFGTGNHRAFTALDPCKKEGDSCKTGIDCCGGFCEIPESQSTEFVANRVGSCKKPEVKRCAKTDEACATKNDCCNPADACIAGFCGQVIIQ